MNNNISFSYHIIISYSTYNNDWYVDYEHSYITVRNLKRKIENLLQSQFGSKHHIGVMFYDKGIKCGYAFIHDEFITLLDADNFHGVESLDINDIINEYIKRAGIDNNE